MEGRSGSRTSRDQFGMMTMRKGPWLAEEDEILMDYVQKHGPRDWSAIRSKGLLPRTGKSCRLRWVNKLKPDLKTGCKFSAEEERIVIDLQAQFGNKWARIATYLQGRTDNDVKNFWSTRQKRLARLLRTPLPPPRSQKSHGKLPVSSQISAFVDSNFNRISFGGELSNGQCSGNSCTNFSDSMQMTIFCDQNFFNSDMNPPSLEPDRNINPNLTPSVQLDELVPFNHFPLSSPLDLPPILPEGPDLIPGLGDMSFRDEFDRQVAPDYLQPAEALQFSGPETGQHEIKTEEDTTNNGILDSFFDELPADMFDCLDPLPISSAW